MPKTNEQLERELKLLQIAVDKLLIENRELKRWQNGVDMALSRNSLRDTIFKFPRQHGDR